MTMTYSTVMDNVEFGIELEGDGYVVTVLSAYKRKRGASSVKKIDVIPFAIEISNKTNDIERDRAMFFCKQSPVWDKLRTDIRQHIKNEYISEPDLAAKRKAEREKMNFAIRQNLKALTWFDNLKNDPVYQDYAQRFGDKGFHKAAELYTLHNLDKFGFDSMEEAQLFFELLRKSKFESVTRLCRKAAELDYKFKKGIFPDKVHEWRIKQARKTRQVQREISDEITRKEWGQGSLFE